MTMKDSVLRGWLMCGMVLCIGACDRPASNKPSNGLAPGVATPAPGPLTRGKPAEAGWKDLASLAAALGDPMLERDSGPRSLPEMSEIQAAANARLGEYRALRNAEPRVAALADEAADALNEFLAAHRELTGPGADAGSPLLLGIGLLAGNRDVAFSGLQGTLREADRRVGVVKSYVSAFERTRGAQLTLASLAQKFATTSEAKGAVSIDLDESWDGATTSTDTLWLTNQSGIVLNDCIIEVTLTGKDGQSRRNVHTVKTWHPGATKSTRYGMGVEFGGSAIGRQTVKGVNAVSVSLWSSELRSERINYEYAGAEKDRDIRAYCEGKLKVAYEYSLRFLDAQKKLRLTLAGIPHLPKHSVEAVFRRGDDRLTFAWDCNPWDEGQERTFETTTPLPWEPQTVSLVISFPDTSYTCEKELRFK